MTLVIPKEHVGSDIFKAPDETVRATLLAAKEVAHLITEVFQKTVRVALVFEGLGVDHLHAKLYPLTADRHSEGFSTVDGPQASDGELAATARLLRKIPNA